MNQVAGRHLGIHRESIYFRLVDQQIERIESSQKLVVCAVEGGPRLSPLVQLLHSRLCLLLQLPDRSKSDGVGGTGLGAGWLHAGLQPVVTEGALLGDVGNIVDADDSEGTCADAGSTAVAGVGLNYDGVELGADDGTGGADLETGGVDAVLADVTHHQPAPVGSVLAELLDKLDVPPVDSIQLAGVVVAVPAHLVLPAPGRGELVPLLAGHLARFAADAYGGVGVEAHGLLGQGGGRAGLQLDSTAAVPGGRAWREALRLLCPHRWLAVPLPRCPAAHAFSTLHTNAFPS